MSYLELRSFQELIVLSTAYLVRLLISLLTRTHHDKKSSDDWMHLLNRSKQVMPTASNLHLYSKRMTSLNRTLIRLRGKFACLSQFQKYLHLTWDSFHNKVNVNHFLQIFKTFDSPGTAPDMTKWSEMKRYVGLRVILQSECSRHDLVHLAPLS